MNSNNFIEIKINMEHVFLGLVPPTQRTQALPPPPNPPPTHTARGPLHGPPAQPATQGSRRQRTQNFDDEETGRPSHARHQGKQQRPLLRFQAC